MLFHHDSVGKARIFECCRTSRHRLLNTIQHLRTNRHLQLLSGFVTHSSCRQGRNQHHLDKEQTVFLVRPCLTVFRLDLVRKEQCTSVCAKITPVPVLSNTTKRQDGFLNLTRVEKHSNCPSFWKFECHQSSKVEAVQITKSFPQRPHVCLAFAFLVVLVLLCVAVVTGGIVVGLFHLVSSSLSPNVQFSCTC